MSTLEEVTEQKEMADALVDDLDANGHDVTLYDLLDCLASTGLVLARGTTAASAYGEAIAGRL